MIGEAIGGMLLGAGIACLIWFVGMVIWCIIADRRDERRFKAWVRGTDAGRDEAWREMGVSEETIALYYTKRQELMDDPEKVTWN